MSAEGLRLTVELCDSAGLSWEELVAADPYELSEIFREHGIHGKTILKIKTAMRNDPTGLGAKPFGDVGGPNREGRGKVHSRSKSPAALPRVRCHHEYIQSY